MNIIMDNVPCVRIVPRNGQRDFVNIINTQGGCFAQFGNNGGAHTLNLNNRGGRCPDVSVVTYKSVR